MKKRELLLKRLKLKKNKKERASAGFPGQKHTRVRAFWSNVTKTMDSDVQ
jgi:hypothetical protein